MQAESSRVLITGASSGIGAATAVEFARRGATLAICARRADRLADTAAACVAAGAASVHEWVLDLSDLDAIEGFAAAVRADLGGIDVLVNNAGSPKRRTMQAITVDEFDATMAINFASPMRLTLAMVPHMVERGSGFIINVGSSGTRKFCGRVGAYVAAKAAIDAFTEALYFDLAGTGVEARLFIPGSTATEFSTDKPDNDPPFAMPASMYESAENVAAAIVGALDADGLEVYPSEEERRLCEEKRADFNGYLRERRQWFLGRADDG